MATIPTVNRKCRECEGHGGWTVNPNHPSEEHTYDCSECNGEGTVPFKLSSCVDVQDAMETEGWQAVVDAYRAAGYTHEEALRALADYAEDYAPMEASNG